MLLFIGTAGSGWARPHPTPTPSPSPPPADPAVTKLVRQQFVTWQAGVIDKELYSEQVLSKLTDAKIADTSHALGAMGALNEAVFLGPWIEPDFPPGASGYIYKMRCTDGDIYVLMALDAHGKIASILFKDRLDVETVTPGPSTAPIPTDRP
jgi:hypothetical protein